MVSKNLFTQEVQLLRVTNDLASGLVVNVSDCGIRELGLILRLAPILHCVFFQHFIAELLQTSNMELLKL